MLKTIPQVWAFVASWLKVQPILEDYYHPILPQSHIQGQEMPSIPFVCHSPKWRSVMIWTIWDGGHHFQYCNTYFTSLAKVGVLQISEAFINTWWIECPRAQHVIIKSCILLSTTTLHSVMNAKGSQQRIWHSHKNGLSKTIPMTTYMWGFKSASLYYGLHVQM